MGGKFSCSDIVHVFFSFPDPFFLLSFKFTICELQYDEP